MAEYTQSELYQAYKAAIAPYYKPKFIDYLYPKFDKPKTEENLVDFNQYLAELDKYANALQKAADLRTLYFRLYIPAHGEDEAHNFARTILDTIAKKCRQRHTKYLAIRNQIIDESFVNAELVTNTAQPKTFKPKTNSDKDQLISQKTKDERARKSQKSKTHKPKTQFKQQCDKFKDLVDSFGPDTKTAESCLKLLCTCMDNVNIVETKFLPAIMSHAEQRRRRTITVNTEFHGRPIKNTDFKHFRIDSILCALSASISLIDEFILRNEHILGDTIDNIIIQYADFLINYEFHAQLFAFPLQALLDSTNDMLVTCAAGILKHVFSARNDIPKNVHSTSVVKSNMVINGLFYSYIVGSCMMIRGRRRLMIDMSDLEDDMTDFFTNSHPLKISLDEIRNSKTRHNYSVIWPECAFTFETLNLPLRLFCQQQGFDEIKPYNIAMPKIDANVYWAKQMITPIANGVDPDEAEIRLQKYYLKAKQSGLYIPKLLSGEFKQIDGEDTYALHPLENIDVLTLYAVAVSNARHLSVVIPPANSKAKTREAFNKYNIPFLLENQHIPDNITHHQAIAYKNAAMPLLNACIFKTVPTLTRKKLNQLFDELTVKQPYIAANDGIIDDTYAKRLAAFNEIYEHPDDRPIRPEVYLRDKAQLFSTMKGDLAHFNTCLLLCDLDGVFLEIDYYFDKLVTELPLSPALRSVIAQHFDQTEHMARCLMYQLLVNEPSPENINWLSIIKKPLK